MLVEEEEVVAAAAAEAVDQLVRVTGHAHQSKSLHLFSRSLYVLSLSF